MGGSKVELDYSITTPAVPGGVGLAIDLTTVSYNPHPTTAGCYNNQVSLVYDGDRLWWMVRRGDDRIPGSKRLRNPPSPCYDPAGGSPATVSAGVPSSSRGWGWGSRTGNPR